MQPTTILGLSVNTRMLGLAIITHGQLEDVQIQLRKEPWTPQKKERILASLQPWCTSYNIHSVALSIPQEQQTTKELKELLAAIQHFFKRKKLHLKTYSVKAVYSFCNKAKKRREMMTKLVILHPELCGYYQKEMRNKNKYYIKLFEAVGVATLHYERLKENKKQGKEIEL